MAYTVLSNMLSNMISTIKALWQPIQTEQEPIQPAHGQQALISSCTRLCWPGWDRKCAKEAGLGFQARTVQSPVATPGHLACTSVARLQEALSSITGLCRHETGTWLFEGSKLSARSRRSAWRACCMPCRVGRAASRRAGRRAASRRAGKEWAAIPAV